MLLRYWDTWRILIWYILLEDFKKHVNVVFIDHGKCNMQGYMTNVQSYIILIMIFIIYCVHLPLMLYILLGILHLNIFTWTFQHHVYWHEYFYKRSFCFCFRIVNKLLASLLELITYLSFTVEWTMNNTTKCNFLQVLISLTKVTEMDEVFKKSIHYSVYS